MRKLLPAAAICIVLALASCASTDKAEFSSEECAHAMSLAIATAQSNALSDIYNDILDGRLLFIPPSLSAVENRMDDIPGMATLAGLWRDEASRPVMDSIDGFRELVDSLIGDEDYVDAISQAVGLGNSSAADTLRQMHRDDIRAFILEAYSNVNLQPLKDCIVQYNTWVSIQMKMTGKRVGNEISIPSDEQLLDLVVDHVTDTYFEILANAEELYRTTPDPYADATAAKVFGLM